LKSLEKRIEALERPMVVGMDPLEFAISTLTDNELGLIEEYRALYKSGFNIEQAKEMMGEEFYEIAVEAIQKVDQELQRLTMPPTRQLVAKPKMRATIDGGIGGSGERAGIDYDSC